MSDRTFLIQRYATGNWPQVKGEIPFFATGPWFKTWAYGLEKFGEWRFVGDLGRQFDEAYSATGDGMDPRFYAAWALLECGFVEALWAGHSRVSESDRWMAAVDQLSLELPTGPIGEAVVEFLSGLSGAAHYRSYVAEDQIELVSMPCPTS